MSLSFDQLTKLIDISIALGSIVLVIFGWIIPYKQSQISAKEQRAFDKRLQSAKWEKEHIDNQISMFYGPIAELLREQALRKELIRIQLNRDSVFQSDKPMISDLSENDQQIWIHFMNTYSIPIQSKILEIIQGNLHLVYNSENPDCFRSFMEYVIGLELLDNQKRSGVQNFYEYHYVYNYPSSFNLYIENTLSLLLNRQNEIIKLCIKE